MNRGRIAPGLALLLAACGYSFGVDEFGTGIRTVAVDIADNRTFRQGLEVPLTRELQRALAEHTDLRPTSRERADAVLKVSIDSVQGQGLVRGGTPVREGSLDFVATAQLIERGTGTVLRSRTLRDRGEFRIPVGETTESATNEAISDLARKIVLALEADF